MATSILSVGKQPEQAGEHQRKPMRQLEKESRMTPSEYGRRVLVVDHNAILADMICRLISETYEFSAAAVDDSMTNVMHRVAELKPDVIVIDPAVTGQSAENFLAAVAEISPATAGIAYIRSDACHEGRAALAAGFAGVVSRGAGLGSIQRALLTAADGGIYIDDCFAREWFNGTSQEDFGDDSETGPLSPREQAVLEQVARGFSSKEIARHLSLSPKTVQTYKSRAAAKLGLGSRSAILLYALQNNWLADPA
jgi:DNA-binding NarL/FixJ family response regulator